MAKQLLKNLFFPLFCAIVSAFLLVAFVISSGAMASEQSPFANIRLLAVAVGAIFGFSIGLICVAWKKRIENRALKDSRQIQQNYDDLKPHIEEHARMAREAAAQSARHEIQYKKTLCLFESVMNALGDSAFLMDSDFRIVMANTLFLDWLQTIKPTECDISGKTLWEVYPELPERIQGEYLRVLGTGKSLSTQEKKIIGDKEVLYQINKEPVLDGERVTHILTIIRDITDLSLPWAGSPSRDNRFRDVFENISCGIALMSADGHILTANKTLAFMLGRTCEEVQHLALSDFLDPREIIPFLQAIKDTLAGNVPEPRYTPEDYLRKDGSSFHAYSVFTVFNDPNGYGKCLLCTIFDASAHQNVYEDLRLAEMRLQSLIKHLPVFVWMLDRDLYFTFSDGKGLEHLGLHPGDPDGIGVEEIFRTNDLNFPVLAAMKKAVGGESLSFDFFWNNHHFQAFVEPCRNDDGDISGCVCTGSDITELNSAEQALEKLNTVYRNLYESVSLGVVYSDIFGHILDSNTAFQHMIGYTGDKLRSMSIEEITVPEDMHRERIIFREMMASRQDTCFLEKHYIRQDGLILIANLTMRVIRDSSGEPFQVLALVEDITERRHTEEEFARLSSFADLNPNPVLEVELNGRICYLNPEAKRLFLRILKTGRGHPFLANLVNRAQDYLQRGITTFTCESDVEGVWYHQVVHFVDNNKRLRIYGLDVTARRMAEERLRFEALHDTLTRLPNRNLFMDRLQHAISRTLRNKEYRFAVLYVDLDDFKNVNDSLGHNVGDELLLELAARLQAYFRPEDTIARLGGDEFAILLESIEGEKDAADITRRLLALITQPFSLSGRQILISASIGIALCNTPNLSVQEILRDADTSMYHAKHRGKNQYVIFTPDMHQAVISRSTIEEDLRRGIQCREFIMYYQPVFDLNQGQIVALDAMVRWSHPDRGLILPGEFIPIAEDTGLILPLGQQICEMTCREIKRMQEKYDPKIRAYLYLSPHQFADPYLASHLEHILLETEVPPETICLEITESLLSERTSSVQIFESLKKLGLTLFLDDFGIGYSCLSHLHHLPLDAIKIDRCFITKIHERGESWEIVKSIRMLAGNLGLKTIAEGVESEEHVSLLKSIGCDYAQGFHFARPMSVSQIEEFFSLRGDLPERPADRAPSHPAIND